MIDQGMDHLLANHFANIFSRDPYAVPKDNLINQDSHFTGNFDIKESHLLESLNKERNMVEGILLIVI